jgi:hypothetical protein
MSTICVKLTVHLRCHRGTPGTRLKRSPVEFLMVSLARVRAHQYKSACNVVKRAVGFNYVPPSFVDRILNEAATLEFWRRLSARDRVNGKKSARSFLAPLSARG